MLKRRLGQGLAVALAAGLVASCTRSSATRINPGQGTLYTFVGDLPACDVLSFRFELTGFTISRTGSTTATAVLNPNADTLKINLGNLKDFTTFLKVGTAFENSYEQATLRLVGPSVVIYDPSLNPPVRTIPLTFRTATPTVPIEPPLVVVNGKVNALLVDFDMLRSLELTSQGNVTPQANASVRITPLTATTTQPFIHLDDLVGFIRSVSDTSTNPAFTGSFLLQMLSGSLPSPPAVNVQFTKDTQMYGASDLMNLSTGNFVEVDGFVDVNGNLVGESVEVEAQENPANNQIAMIGPILTLTKDAGGNIIGYTQWVRQEEPDDSFQVGLDTVVQVNFSPSTTFQYSSRSANFANVPFDISALAVGQDVVTHGTFTRVSTPIGATNATSATVAASSVYLKLQTVQGNFAALTQVGSDDKTGAFQFTPCCTILKGTPVLVLTSNQTNYVNVTGLSGLTSQPTLWVKGLPFFQPSGGTINGVTVPPGTLVVLAKQVHQLQ